MLGAVHLGLLAACVVLFVTIVMAGWHLSRNKMLFFSCALFITLAVGVHLTPYFPKIWSFLSQSEDIPFDDGNDNCHDKSWDWIKIGTVMECGFTKLKKPDASVLLNGSWVVVAGDSQARLMVVSLLELLMGSEGLERVRGDLFKVHSDYSVIVDEIGMKLDFVWAPYVENLTQLVVRLKQNMSFPDVMVMGAGLWDMLHVNNASAYGASLRTLKHSTLTLLPVSSDMDTRDGARESMSTQLLHLFWVGMPTLMTSMLNTEEKREKMTNEVSNFYENEINKSKLLLQSGGPLLKLDIRLLS